MFRKSVYADLVLAAASVVGLTFIAPLAYADCGVAMRGAMRPTVYLGDFRGGLLKTGYEEQAAITGLWKFTFTSDGKGSEGAPPAGVPVDAGFVTWHDDGTEIMNSGRAPVSGSFCMGVWKQVAPRTYRLNHWALSWVPGYVPGVTQTWPDGTGNDAFEPAGPANIQETITLSPNGMTYTGTFKILNYMYDGVNVTDALGEPFVISGTVAATRITP